MKRRKSKSIFSGKGFYITLAVCLAAVGASAFFALSRTRDYLAKDQTLDLSSAVISANEWGFPKSANNTKEDVTMSSEPSQSSSYTSSSSKKSRKTSKATAARSNSEKQQTISLAMPFSGEITNKFSNGELVKSETLGDWRTHDGIDISAKSGTPVKAAADGTVTDITDDTIWGVTVTIDHKNGYTASYSGLTSSVNVKKGQDVKLGDVIGAVGETALCELKQGPHVHFSVKYEDKFIDPESIIKN